MIKELSPYLTQIEQRNIVLRPTKTVEKAILSNSLTRLVCSCLHDIECNVSYWSCPECRIFYVNEGICKREFDTIQRNSQEHEQFRFDGPEDARRRKNRYIDVLPHPENRVKLPLDLYNTNDYINADFIPGGKIFPRVPYSYIAASAPVANEGSIDFWLMVWDKECGLILMLTDLIENKTKKADLYWPRGGDTMTYGSVRVRPEALAMQFPHFSVRRFFLSHANDEKNEREVTHLWFTAWPDSNIPQNSLFDFIRTYRGYRELLDTKCPILCHCSAGIGRTGCFIAIDLILDSISSEVCGLEENNHFPSIDIFRVVSKLRTYRMGMVQTLSQYLFIYHFLQSCIQQQLFGVVPCVSNIERASDLSNTS
jgi:protein tyrosine phosphatase